VFSEQCNLEGRDVVALYTVGQYAVIINPNRRERGMLRRWCVVNWVEGWVEGWYLDQYNAVMSANKAATEWQAVLDVVMV